ncbi:MAG: ATP-binding cassette domain-containing protein [Sumerlaeia bacterium]
MLEVRDLKYLYPGSEEGVKGVSFSVPRERVFAILGRSGSGKTTLLRCLGRFLRPQSGAMLLDDRDLSAMPEAEFRRSLGIVFQQFHLFPHLTVRENATLAPVQAHGRSASEARADAGALFERFGITPLADKYPNEISGGQAQRAAICRALMLKPQYILLDEPTSALDAETTREFGEFLMTLKEETTFIVVTHDVAFVEGVAAHGVLMEGGVIKETGDVGALVGALTG